MKRPIQIAMLALLIPVTTYSQVIEGIPVDENGKINFNEVVQTDSVKASELYLRAKHLFVDLFKSGKDVIQLDDKESALIVGKGFSDIPYRTGMGGTVNIQMWYTIKIASKDGRYRYEIYDLFYKSYPSDIYPNGITTPVEDMLDKKKYYKKNGSPQRIFEEYKIQTQTAVNGLIESIKAGMSKSATGSKKDDW